MLHIQNVIGFLPGTSISYKSEGGIAHLLFNEIPADLETGTYTQFGKDLIFALEDPSMSRLGEAREIDYSEFQEPYLTKPYALKTALPMDLTSLTPTNVNRVQQGITGLTDTLDRWYEKQGAAMCGTFSSTAVAKAWTDPTSTPLKSDIKPARAKLAMAPNVAVIDKLTYDVLVNNPEIVAQRNTAAAGTVTKEELAKILEVKEVLVPEMKGNLAVKGRAENLGYIWGTIFMFAYRNPQPEIGPEQITFAARISLQEFGLKGAPTEAVVYAASEKGTLVRAWENPNRGFAGASMIQVGRKYELKKIGPDLAWRLTGMLG